MNPEAPQPGVETRGRLTHQPALDGLRGVAVATVLLYHAGFRWMPGGYLGVSTFFTLSGYLITTLLLAEHERKGRINLAAFWERRFRRILPASFLALMLVTLFGRFAADRYQLEHLRSDVLATLGYVVNWWFIFTRRDYADIFGSPSPVQHFWSLAIEEQFYLVLPLLVAGVLGFCRGSRRVFAIVVAVLCSASVLRLLLLIPTDAPTARLYYGTDTRAAELFAGSLLAVTLANPRAVLEPWQRRGRDMLGIAGLAVSIGFWLTVHQEDNRLYAGGLALYTLGTAAILSSAVLPSGMVRALLSLEPLQQVGRISYGLYLYHFPVFLWLTEQRTGLAGWSLFLLRIVPAALIAYASSRWIEMPIRTGRVVHGRARWLFPPAAALVSALAIVAVTANPEAPAQASVAAIAAPTQAAARPSGLRIMVVGDSVGERIASGLDRWAHETGRATVLIATIRGCGIAKSGTQTTRDERLRAETCDKWIAGWHQTLDEFRPDVVLVYTGGWDLMQRQLPDSSAIRSIGEPPYDNWLRSEFERAVAVLSSRGAHVVWVSALCVRVPEMQSQNIVYDVKAIGRLNEIVSDMAASNSEHLGVVDLFSQVCPRGVFTNTLHGIDGARPDGMHFSPEAADWVAHWLAPQLLRDEGRVDRSSPAPARRS